MGMRRSRPKRHISQSSKIASGMSKVIFQKGMTEGSPRSRFPKVLARYFGFRTASDLGEP